jgi:DNA polymerase III epsilon subunit family exonuclease
MAWAIFKKKPDEEMEKEIPSHVPIKKCYADEPVYDKFVVVDFETTGLSPKSNQIIEVGAVKIKDGSIVDTYSTLVNPGVKIPKGIVKMTGIDDSMVKKAPKIDHVMPLLLEFINGLPMVAHNAPFDAGFLEANIDHPIDFPLVDTLRFCRRYYPSFENHKLETICQNLEITSEGFHRALADCNVTARVYLKCQEQYLLQTRLPRAISAEKEGNITEAVDLYEQLIIEDFEGDRPYERLAIIYRKQKAYQDEVRVLNKAIMVFEKLVNADRSDRQNKLDKFKTRLQKAEELSLKQGKSISLNS